MIFLSEFQLKGTKIVLEALKQVLFLINYSECIPLFWVCNKDKTAWHPMYWWSKQTENGNKNQKKLTTNKLTIYVILKPYQLGVSSGNSNSWSCVIIRQFKTHNSVRDYGNKRTVKKRRTDYQTTQCNTTFSIDTNWKKLQHLFNYILASKLQLKLEMVTNYN